MKMHNQKKSFALLLTIFLLTTFSLLGIYILEIKTFQSDTQTKQFHQIQAKFHLNFAKDFIENLDLNNESEPCIYHISINNKSYKIFADISYISQKSNCSNSNNIEFEQKYTQGVALIDLYVESKSSIFKIKLHDRFLKKL